MLTRRSFAALLGLITGSGSAFAAEKKSVFSPPTVVRGDGNLFSLLTYRTRGPWGDGKGDKLTMSDLDRNFYALEKRMWEMDVNFYELEKRIRELETNGK